MKGRIYIIRSKQTDKVYIGSTVQSLNKRFRLHKIQDCTSQEILKYSDAEIILLECYECENKEQLKNREGEYIRQYNCVNKNIAGRTRKEWIEDNKEYFKEYYQENKEKLNEKKKEYREKNKEAIAEHNKEYRQKNREIIAEKANEKFTCECGGKYTHSNKARHFKTEMHLEFLTKEN